MINDNPYGWIYDIFTAARKQQGKQGAFNDRLAQAIKDTSRAYRKGQQPDLGSFINQIAYIVQQFPTGMSMMRRICERLQNRMFVFRHSVFSFRPLHIVSVGAGPGTDLFGILNSLDYLPHRVKFTRIDMEAKWGRMFKALSIRAKNRVNQLTSVLNQVDDEVLLEDLSDGHFSAECTAALQSADIVVFSRVLSVFLNNTPVASSLIQDAAAAMSPGSILMISDIAAQLDPFREMLFDAQELCTQGNPRAEWIAEMELYRQPHFGWHIHNDIVKLGSRGGYQIKRGAHYYNGAVLMG